MLQSYIKLALRNFIKHRMYALINIAGLALGLMIFLFGAILVSYEKNHDNMFSKRDRIYTVGSIFSPNAGTGIREYPVVRTAYGPIFDLEIEDAELVSRVIHGIHLLSVEDKHFYQNIRFAEKGFTKIFDFEYIGGDPTAINDPRGLILTESTAKKLFGRINIIGEILVLDHKYDFYVKAVIKDVASDSHFNSSFLPDNQLTVIASLEALVNIKDFKMEGEWESLNPYNFTYILLAEGRDKVWLQNQVEAISERHAPEKETEYLSELKVRPLIEANIQIWDAFGFPVLESVQLLGLLILIIACLNYTNLATAQSFGRSREVGLRKTLGAERSQLLLQFLLESQSLAFFSMILALACIEIIIPYYNSVTGKAVLLDYFSNLPFLLIITIIVGFLAGIYPAYLISRVKPIDSLQSKLQKGRRGSTFRSFMIALQFSISIFMLAMVMIIYFQNEKMKELSNMFLKSHTVILEQVDVAEIQDKHETLRNEFKYLEEVEAVTFSSAVPYNGSLPSVKVSREKGDETVAFDLNIESIDYDFMEAYDIGLLSGRPFNKDIANDFFREDAEQVNIIINQLTAQKLGYEKAEDAISNVFYKIPDKENPGSREYVIIGIMPDQYFYGTHSEIAPIAFLIDPERHNLASIKVKGKDLSQTLQNIDMVWDRVIENYPIKRKFLDFYFNLFFRFPEGINNVLAVFSLIALSLALFGLFGLAAFIAQSRTKEIGIRKVLGASVFQVVRLLIWQFSKPVSWSLIIAIPLSYLASSIYLDFFPERIGLVFPVILLASIIGVLTAWFIVAGQAIGIARLQPVKSLRYE